MLQNPGRFLFLASITVLITCGSGWGAVSPGPLDGAMALAPSPEARQAWRAVLPLRSIDAIESWHLVEGYLYAIGNEGSAHCIRVDTGRLLWSRRLTNPPGTIYPPVPYRSPEFYAVAFTLSSEVVLLDPETGSEFKRIRLQSPASASAGNSPGFIYSAETNRHIRAYDLKDNVMVWQILMDGPVSVPPVYQPDLTDGTSPVATLVMADGSGQFGMVWADDKELVYAHKLGGEPQGEIATDGTHFFVATSDNLVNCLDRKTGETLWSYRLPAKPDGAPVICRGSIYQAVAPSGLQRIGIERDRPNWFAPDAVQFLAEWNGRPVVLLNDRQVAILDPLTGEAVAFVQTGEVVQALSNPINEALFLVSPAGEARCMLPAGTSPASLAALRPATTQPASAEAGTGSDSDQPTTRPALVRKPKQTDDIPLWVRSSGTHQQSGDSGVRRSTRSSRGDRSAGSSRSSRRSRGDRSSRESRGGRSRSRGGRAP
ncbi:MAG TPA: PQQ-binding-like beta-propeller repeat protein [Phycisphaerae bacterium]|jgi:hypothetical protein|nr:PQQ-binding-like beta-propeller repeat protein [Phycisphaerae bacterium]HOB75629.1 PQQ-binding-like beta-propeller repeat protein [Phycisphaerae bacterium]HOJ56302.1 PQQ-binding-like beta-propeller repeat protein [Phycisphaerae bacterium]HOL28197.1 PQQ-binding-like beta-propeller repeat protein [Phycisphaerae bacterium]HPP22449.1 PQQ-binding-like beta-propeller repeat protein [Phycisphaerae bacterium]